MGNLCNGKAASEEHQSKLRASIEREVADERDRAIQDGLRNMANGGHQMIAGLSVPLTFHRKSQCNYYNFNWGEQGEVGVTSFGVKIVAANGRVDFVEGLANYATFTAHWTPDTQTPGNTIVTLGNYKSVDANTGEQTPVNTCAKKFIVSPTGVLIEVVNLDELVGEAVELAVAAASMQQPGKSPSDLAELRSLLHAQRDVMIKGVVDDLQMMWTCWVQLWSHQINDGKNCETVYKQECVRKKHVVSSDAEENKKILERFYEDLFVSMGKEGTFRPHVSLDQAKQMVAYNSLFKADGIKPHQCSYRKFTESAITIQGITSERAEFEGKRWVFAWPDVPELSGRGYMVSLFSEYAGLGGRFHDALVARYVDNNTDSDVFALLENLRFVTEPDEHIVAADEAKQRFTSLMQMASAGHSMFSGLSPTISWKQDETSDVADEKYRFQWPESGCVRVAALGFTIKIVDTDVSFTQGLGTYIMFDVRWERGTRNDVQGTHVFLENNVLVHASGNDAGVEAPLSEPVKHMFIDEKGELVEVVNMEALLNFAIDTAIGQKGPHIAPEERAAYREMLETTQRETLIKAVWCDLAFIWASWVQLWIHHSKSQSNIQRKHSVQSTPCVELEQLNASSPIENEKTVLSLIESVVCASGEMHNRSAIQVQKATQEESYKTLFESHTIRPIECNYQKITETELTFNVEDNNHNSSNSSNKHVVIQKEFKNSRHVFLWPDVRELATPTYIQEVYQDYLDLAQEMYSQLKK